MVSGSRSAVTVTRDTLDEHRETRRLGEEAGAGQPVEVRYRNIPFERMYTTDVVESVVRPMALKKHESYAESEAPPGTLDLPTYFISHAWGSVFVDLVEAVAAELNGAGLDEGLLPLSLSNSCLYGESLYVRQMNATNNIVPSYMHRPRPPRRSCGSTSSRSTRTTPAACSRRWTS